MTPDLFASEAPGDAVVLGPQARVLRGLATARAAVLLEAVEAVAQRSPFRHMQTPGGFTMSVATTNCGSVGWTSDRRGYRYAAADPLSGQAWPPLPTLFLQLAAEAAAQCGFADFVPDACLVNRYAPGTKLSLHQDRDEQDLHAPIVSVSLGMPAVFLFGGMARGDRAVRVPLWHGDVVVWGGVDRLRFHGVLPLKDQPHPLLGRQRINLTFRKAA